MMDGFLHPLSAPDHVLAMMAVALWSSQLGRPRIWLLPVAFSMIAASAALFGVVVAGAWILQISIAVSILLLGFLLALDRWLPPWLAAPIVAVLAILHGHGHGAALTADTLAYSAGLMVGTGLLLAAGTGLGLLLRQPDEQAILPICGVAIVGCGLYFLVPLMVCWQ